MKAAGKHTQNMWDAIIPIYEETITHPFVLLLANGSLKEKNFAHYLAQDILYLKDDNLALDIAAEKAPNKSEKAFFHKLAKDGLDIERALHDEFLKHFNVQAAEKKSPVIEKYTSFLVRHSKESDYAVALSALLPCFWVYTCIGNHILSIAKENNPYQMWIDTYHSEEYEQYTQRFIDIVEHLASEADESLQKEMMDAFILSTQYELDFFEESMKF